MSRTPETFTTKVRILGETEDGYSLTIPAGMKLTLDPDSISDKSATFTTPSGKRVVIRHEDEKSLRRVAP